MVFTVVRVKYLIPILVITLSGGEMFVLVYFLYKVLFIRSGYIGQIPKDTLQSLERSLLRRVGVGTILIHRGHSIRMPYI